MALGIEYLRLYLFFIFLHAGYALSASDGENSIQACTTDAGCGDIGESDDPDWASTSPDEVSDVRLLQKQFSVRRPQAAPPASPSSVELDTSSADEAVGLAQDSRYGSRRSADTPAPRARELNDILGQYDPLELVTKLIESVNVSLSDAMIQIDANADKSVKILSRVQTLAGFFSPLFKQHVKQTKSLIENLKKMISDYVVQADGLVVKAQSKTSELLEQATSLREMLLQQIAKVEDFIILARNASGSADFATASLLQTERHLIQGPFSWLRKLWHGMFRHSGTATADDEIDKAEGILQKIREYLDHMRGSMNDTVKSVFDGINESVQSLASKAKDLLGDASLPKKLTSSVTRALESIQTGVTQQASSTITHTQELVATAVAQSKELMQKLADHLKALRVEAKQLAGKAPAGA